MDVHALDLHITDDQSFPMASESYPNLPGAGSFGPNYVYSKADVLNITAYAKAHGVIVVPEFDMVGSPPPPAGPSCLVTPRRAVGKVAFPLPLFVNRSGERGSQHWADSSVPRVAVTAGP